MKGRAKHSIKNEKLEMLDKRDSPEDRKGRYSTLATTILWFTNSVITMASSIVIIPSQVKELVGDSSKGKYMGVIVSCCAVTSLICSPIFGVLSDRTRSRFGRRRPFLLGGSLVVMLCLLSQALFVPRLRKPPLTPANHSCVVDQAKKRCIPYRISAVDLEKVSETPERHNSMNRIRTSNLVFFSVLNIGACVAQASVSVAYHGLLADNVSAKNRGFVSGFMGFMALLGNMVGSTTGLLLNTLKVFYIYLILCGMNILSLLIVIVVCQESTDFPQELTSLSPFTILSSFVTPLKNYNFRWVFITRFLMQQGVATVTAFLEFWIDDMVRIPRCWSSEAGLTFILLPMLLSSAVFSILMGFVSDATGKRKWLIFYSCLIMAVCALTIAFSPENERFYYGLLSSCLFGVGYGSFTSVDFALVMDITEKSPNKAADLAVWHQAMVLPSCVATPIGGIIMDGFQRVNCKAGLGYTLVYCVSAAYFLLSALFVLKLKKIS